MDEQGDNPAGEENAPPPQEPKAEALQFDPVGARLTDRVAEGTLSTGVIILDGPDEFILDFIQGVAQPSRVAARVVMSPRVVGQFLSALKANLQMYEQAFGKPAGLPRPEPERRPNIKDVYDGLKLSDDKLSGAYANAVRIGHSPSEFCFDFITRFFPTAAVSARIYMTAPQVPRLLESLTASYNHYLSKTRQPPRPPNDLMM
jgi:hypothetical protein